MPGKSVYSKKLDYNNAYNRKTYKSFSVRFNKKTETDLIAWLESKDSLKEYFVELIKKDMEKSNKKSEKKKSGKDSGKKKSSKKEGKKSSKK